MPAGSESRRALVTGASSGIGAAFARKLGAQGFDLVVVARRRERLEKLAEQLREDTGIGVEVVAADLTDPGQLLRLEALIAQDAALGLLVNNAGFGGYMPFAELDPQLAEALIRVHILALTRLTRAALPGMIERGRGAIVNVSSLLGSQDRSRRSRCHIARPMLLRRPTWSSSPRRSRTSSTAPACAFRVLCPGLVKTEFHEVAGFDRAQVPFPPMEPEEIVDASLAGLELGEVTCIPGLEDLGVIEQAAEKQRAVFQTAIGGPLAGRYATPS